MRVWILADVSSSIPGGMRRHMELHAEGLRRLGHEVSLFWSDDFPRVPPLAVTKRLPGWRSLLHLLPEYRRQRPDIVNVHTGCAPAWAFARRTGLVDAKVVAMSYAAADWSFRLHTPADGLRWALSILPARATFQHLDGIWCANQQDLELYVETYGIPRERLRRLGHPIADKFFAVPREPARRPKKILFCGTWIVRKGIDVLAPALERVVTEVSDVEIVLAGTISGEDVVRSSLAPSVLARTRVIDQTGDDELAAEYVTSSILLVPSRLEGLPISMLEAMACGCPPLAAANSGMLDVVQPGRNGWLEVSFDAATWAARIVALLRDPQGLVVASRGAEELASRFTIEANARAAVAWYESLLGRQ